MFSIIIFRIFFFSLLLFSSQVFSSDNCDENTSFYVKAALDSNDIVWLDLELVSCSDRALDFYGNPLARDFVVLVPVQDKFGGEKLREVALIEDYMSSVTTLSPRGKLSSKIKLSRYFPDIREEIINTGVILFWSIDLETTPKHGLRKRFGGYLLME